MKQPAAVCTSEKILCFRRGESSLINVRQFENTLSNLLTKITFTESNSYLFKIAKLNTFSPSKIDPKKHFVHYGNRTFQLR